MFCPQKLRYMGRTRMKIERVDEDKKLSIADHYPRSIEKNAVISTCSKQYF
jgi:hypothetical protein